jgi:hypothetical protein
MFANVLGTGLPVVLLQSYGGTEFSLYTLIAWLPWLLIVYLLIRFIGKVNQPTITDHKYQLFELTQLSTMDFYKNVEGILSELRIAELKWFRITHAEGGGILSARREYLRVMYKGLGYTICGSGFGTSFFISWREDEPVASTQKTVSGIPFVGKYLAIFFRKTRYQEDTEIMYREMIQGIMEHLIAVMGKEKGTRGLAELEQKPVYVKPSVPHAEN